MIGESVLGRAALVPAMCAILTTACLPGARSPRLYVLSSVGMAGVAAPPAAARGPAIGIGPIGLAGYLDRSAIVTRPSGDEVAAAALHHWGEPLKEGTPRILAENLAILVPTDSAVVFPWRATWTVQYRVTMDITRFDGALGGPVVLVGRWRLLDATGKELTLRPIILSEPTREATYGALVGAQSRLLASVSRDIAAEIKAQAK